jgi:DNA-binding GntR family transcriptional regulator
MTSKCISEKCYSPVACEGFGYCRELHLGAARKAVDLMSEEQLKAMRNRVKTLKDIAEETYEVQDMMKKIFKNMPGGTP